MQTDISQDFSSLTRISLLNKLHVTKEQVLQNFKQLCINILVKCAARISVLFEYSLYSYVTSFLKSERGVNLSQNKKEKGKTAQRRENPISWWVGVRMF